MLLPNSILCIYQIMVIIKAWQKNNGVAAPVQQFLFSFLDVISLLHGWQSQIVFKGAINYFSIFDLILSIMSSKDSNIKTNKRPKAMMQISKNVS